MTDSNTDIAVVSLAQPLDSIAAELGRSFEEYGFAVVRDHGIPQARPWSHSHWDAVVRRWD